MDDSRLTQYALAVQEGDMSSFRPLVESLSRMLIAVAFRYVHDWESAMDITQETWIKVYDAIHRYDPRYPVRSWISAIHRNNCISHLRSEAARHKYEDQYKERQWDHLQTRQSNPFFSTVRNEFGERLRKAMQRLTDSQRTVFSLVEIEQFTQKDAARMLGMKHATLRSTLHFARKQLARILRNLEELS